MSTNLTIGNVTSGRDTNVQSTVTNSENKSDDLSMNPTMPLGECPTGEGYQDNQPLGEDTSNDNDSNNDDNENQDKTKKIGIIRRVIRHILYFICEVVRNFTSIPVVIKIVDAIEKTLDGTKDKRNTNKKSDTDITPE